MKKGLGHKENGESEIRVTLYGFGDDCDQLRLSLEDFAKKHCISEVIVKKNDQGLVEYTMKSGWSCISGKVIDIIAGKVSVSDILKAIEARYEDYFERKISFEKKVKKISIPVGTFIAGLTGGITLWEYAGIRDFVLNHLN